MSRFQALTRLSEEKFMDIRNLPIEPDKFYHIYNRGVNGEIIFKSDRNYSFFLSKIKDNLLPVCDIYAYCLLPNHFHFLIKVKSEVCLESLVKVSNLDKAKEGLHAPKNIFSKQFSKIFNSYSQAFNKENNRHGALIESPFKRKQINSDEYLRKVILYIHRNPQNHGLSSDFKEYKYSSYHRILSQTKSNLKWENVIELFDDLENFVFTHQQEIDLEEFDY